MSTNYQFMTEAVMPYYLVGLKEVRIIMGHYWYDLRGKAEVGLLRVNHLSMLLYMPEILQPVDWT